MPRQDVAVELFYDSTWHDLVADGDVFAEPITIVRGQATEGAAFRPAGITCTLNNADDRFRITNPESPLYGLAGRNTPIRVKVGGTIRGIAEVSSWSCDETQDFRPSPLRGKAWTTVEAGGILQRINQWTEPLYSPFTQYHLDIGADLIGLWPHEDPNGARSLTALVEGSRSLALRGAKFGSNRFPGSDRLASFENTSSAFTAGEFARVPGGTDTDGWQVGFSIRPGSVGSQTYNFFTIDNLAGTTFALSFNAGDILNLTVETAAPAFTTLIDADFGISGLGINWDVWQHFTVQCTYAAGTTTVRIYLNSEGSDSFIGWDDTYTGEPGQLRFWTARFGGALNTVDFGQVSGTTTIDTNYFSVGRLAASKGHDGETAASRFERLCTLKGIDHGFRGTGPDSALMGPQQVRPLIEQFREIVRTEDAVLYDTVDDLTLTLLLLNGRYLQTPALALDVSDMMRRPREVSDDLKTKNVVTAVQADGGEYTARLDSGLMGTQAPPDGAGEAKLRLDVNVAEPADQLPLIAGWWLGKGTVDEPRYPTVVVDLNAMPDLITAVEGVDVGDVITIGGYREYTIRLWVVGIKEVIGTHQRTVEFTCLPDRQYNAGEYDASRYDSGSTTLAEDLDTTETGVDVTTSDAGDVWSTTAVPYDVLIGGERMTVTACTAAAGSGPYTQTFTVTRSVTVGGIGITKTHSTGAEVHVADPGRYGI